MEAAACSGSKRNTAALIAAGEHGLGQPPDDAELALRLAQQQQAGVGRLGTAREIDCELLAAEGWQHLGHGTRNALVPLEGDKFLEVLAPDSDQSPPKRARWVGIDDLRSPRLTGWAANGRYLRVLV